MLSREVIQFIEIVREAYGSLTQPPVHLESEEGLYVKRVSRGSISRRMFCEGCGFEVEHELVEHADGWEEYRCCECGIYGHWFRVG